MIRKYLETLSLRRVMAMLLGSTALGLGISLFIHAQFGNDAFTAMMLALSDVTGVFYGHFVALFGLGLFVIQLFVGRKYIGLGTIVNIIGIGYIASFFNLIFAVFLNGPIEQQVVRITLVVFGVLSLALGTALYMSADVGLAPYDSLPVVLSKRFPKVPFFWIRISFDGTCALVAFLSGGLIGMGTLLTAFGLGPFIAIFYKLLLPRVQQKKQEGGSYAD